MTEPNRTIALVSCVSEKVDHPAPARGLYISPWFKKASTYATSLTEEWYVLSAKYGLARPDEILAPYNMTLKKMPARERRAWAKDVILDLHQIVERGDRIVILAGERYREFLVGPLQGLGCVVEIPMKGKLIGEQLAWLNRQLGLSNAR